MRFKFLVQVLERHRHEYIDPAQRVVRWNAIFQTKFVEKNEPDRPSAAPSSHRPPLLMFNQPSESWFAAAHTAFFDSIDPEQSSKGDAGTYWRLGVSIPIL